MAVPFSKLGDEDYTAYFFRHVSSMLYKRGLYFSRDIKAWIFLYVIPVAIFFIGLCLCAFSSYRTPTPKKILTTTMYNTDIKTNHLPTQYSSGTYSCVDGTVQSLTGVPTHWWTFYLKYLNVSEIGPYSPLPNFCTNITSQPDLANGLAGASNFPVIPQPAVSSIYSMSLDLFNARTKYQASQIGAYNFFSISSWNETAALNGLEYATKGSYSVDYFVHANYTAKHAGPLYQSMLADSIVKTLNPGASVRVSMQALPQTGKEKAIQQGKGHFKTKTKFCNIDL